MTIIGSTPTGRATVHVLDMNRPLILAIRQEESSEVDSPDRHRLASVAVFPPLQFFRRAPVSSLATTTPYRRPKIGFVCLPDFAWVALNCDLPMINVRANWLCFALFDHRQLPAFGFTDCWPLSLTLHAPRHPRRHPPGPAGAGRAKTLSRWLLPATDRPIAKNRTGPISTSGLYLQYVTEPGDSCSENPGGGSAARRDNPPDPHAHGRYENAGRGALPWAGENFQFSMKTGLVESEKSVSLPHTEGSPFHGWSRTWPVARAKPEGWQIVSQSLAGNRIAFETSRDLWKAKYKSLQERIKAFRTEVRDLRRSRDRWRAKAEALQQETFRLRAQWQRQVEQSLPAPAGGHSQS